MNDLIRRILFTIDSQNEIIDIAGIELNGLIEIIRHRERIQHSKLLLELANPLFEHELSQFGLRRITELITLLLKLIIDRPRFRRHLSNGRNGHRNISALIRIRIQALL